MQDSSDPIPEPGNLRLLRRLVTGLMGVMICGVVVIVALLVTRLSSTTPPLPDEITLPDGAKASALTIGDSWYAVVTQDQRILIYDKTTGQLRQTIAVR